MAQTGYTPIQLYHSTTALSVPLAADLRTGELALNVADGKLYYKTIAGAIQLLTSAGTGGGTVTSVAGSGGTTGLTVSGGPITGAGTLTLGGTLNIANGGTGQITANAALNAFLPNQATNSGKVLSTDGTNTSWITVSGGGGGTVTAVNATFPITTTGGTTPTIGVSNGSGACTTSTGSGALVFNTSPTLVTPALGTPSSINLANATGLTSGQVTTALTYTPPQPNGIGASGTWGINISGTAASASFATSAGSASSASTATSATTASTANALNSSNSYSTSGIFTSTSGGGYSALQSNAVGIGSSSNNISSTTGGGVLNFNISGSLAAALGPTQFVPSPSNTKSLGSPGLFWSEIWVSTGAFNTSDGNQKQQIAELTTAELAVAKTLKGLIRTYKLNSAVAKKGANARIHTGVIAQDVQSAFVAQGLDATKYGIFGSDTWYEVNGSPIDANGRYYTASDANAVKVTQLAIRYDELFAFIIAGL